MVSVWSLTSVTKLPVVVDDVDEPPLLWAPPLWPPPALPDVLPPLPELEPEVVPDELPPPLA
jgi:hypothetical protein